MSFNKLLKIENLFIAFLFKYKVQFLNFIILFHLSLFAWGYPEIVSSALFWILSIIFAFAVGYQNIKKIFLWSFSIGNNEERTKRMIFYIPLLSMPLHGFFFKPDPKFLLIIQKDGQSK